MKDILGYANRRVVVTGCASGIGQAVAEALLEQGAIVHGLDVKPASRALSDFTITDLRDKASIARAAASVGGTVDVLFNCAGIPPGPSPRDVMLVNYVGTRHLTDLLLPSMPDGSAIVNVASTGGAGWQTRLDALKALVGADGMDAAIALAEPLIADAPGVAYALSKEAIIVWTLLECATLIERGIRMNCTIPGAVQTPMLDTIQAMSSAAVIDVVAQPIGRRSSPAEQALPLLFLGSRAASYVNGAMLEVDGGFTATRAVKR